MTGIGASPSIQLAYANSVVTVGAYTARTAAGSLEVGMY